MAALASYGYLHRDGEVYHPQVMMLNIPKIKEAICKLDAETVTELTALSDRIRAQMKSLHDTIADTIKADLPALFVYDAHQCSLAVFCCYHARGYVMEEALRSGWLHPADQLNPAIGSHFYLK